MKLTTLILITVMLHVSASSIAQKVTLKEKNASLTDLFDQIRAQTGYDFALTSDVLANARPVTIDIKNEELKDALSEILKGQDLDFTLDNKIVVIKKKEVSFIDNLKNKIKEELAQVNVTGKVVDETGQPLPGVTVKIKGASNALTSTDANGRFTVTVPDDKTVLVFTSVGYDPQELTAKDIPLGATITLKASVNALSEVQVLNKGYYFEKRELTTGSLSVVGAKTIEQQPVFDPLQALEGQVAGLNIQQSSGIPGAYATVRVRGVNSIANGTTPLYIVDGVPYSNQSLSSNLFGNALGFGSPGNPMQSVRSGTIAGQSPFSVLNLGDIENIEVLKDADATAIYGSRGANGVIIITTKKGKAGATKVNVDIAQGIGRVGHFLDLMNTQQYLQMRREAYTNDGLAIPSIAVTPTNTAFDVNGVWDTTRYTNWQKELIGNTAKYTNTNMSVSGGNVNTQFLIGAGYSRQTTVYPGSSEDQKGSLHFSLSHVSDDQKFSVQLSASYVHDSNAIPQQDFTGRIILAPDAPAIYKPDGSINWQFYNNSPTWGNPFAQLIATSTSISNNLVSSLNLAYKLLPGLSLKANVGYNRNEMNETAISPIEVNPPPAALGGGNFSTTAFETWIVEPQLSYQKKMGRGDLSIQIGGSLQQNIEQNNSMTTAGTSDALLSDPAAANPANTSLFFVYTKYKASSAYGHIGYNWDEKYIVSLTARRDGSSRFGADREFGNFGAIGAGWIFSKEKWLKDYSWLNFGKLRFSYGTTGNDQLADYQYLSTYNPNSTVYQGIAGLAPTRLTNPYFAWEMVKKLEGGLDLGFLNDRIDLSVDFYRDRTDNQLVSYPLSSITGFTSIQYNLPAVVQNTGLEAQVTTNNVKSKDFSWLTTINFTLPNNKLISFPGLASSSYATSFVVGQSLFIKETYQYTGVNPQTGRYTVATANLSGNPSSPQDLVVTAPITQKYYGGIQNSFRYKHVSLDIFIQYVKQLGYNYLKSITSLPGAQSYNQLASVLNSRWTAPGQVTNTELFNTTNAGFNIYNSTATYSDASFVRLKNIALSYELPANWQHWAGFSNARIFVNGQNLYTLTKYVGLDPENAGGGSGLSLPPLRVFMAGLSASF